MYRAIFCTIFLSVFIMAGNTQPVNTPLFFPGINTFIVSDVQQQKDVVLNKAGKQLMLFVFMSPECPVCQNYTKILNSIQQQYNEQLQVYGIVPGMAYSVKDIVAFQKKYATRFNFFIDKKMELTKYLQATTTPQVILLNSTMQLMYSGAIDDWVTSVGKNRVQATQHFLTDAIEQSLHNIPVLIANTKAVGCKINDY